jgi:hypothetical protein
MTIEFSEARFNLEFNRQVTGHNFMVAQRLLEGLDELGVYDHIDRQIQHHVEKVDALCIEAERLLVDAVAFRAKTECLR